MNAIMLRVQATLDDCWLDTEALCRLAGVDEAWLRERADQGLLAPAALGVFDEWRFDARALRRAMRMAALERGFDAVPELAALVADLEDEIAALRARLDRVQERGR
jgi:chaperone modulatory protein CbpM